VLSPATSLGGLDGKPLPTLRLTNRLNFALAGYGLLAGGSVSGAEPANISTTVIGKSTQLIMTVTETTTITTAILGG
jgi:hypothetical protein